jgi:hypothetical protein
MTKGKPHNDRAYRERYEPNVGRGKKYEPNGKREVARRLKQGK